MVHYALFISVLLASFLQNLKKKKKINKMNNATCVAFFFLHPVRTFVFALDECEFGCFLSHSEGFGMREAFQ